jgi:hypothetical protein
VELEAAPRHWQDRHPALRTISPYLYECRIQSRSSWGKGLALPFGTALLLLDVASSVVFSFLGGFVSISSVTCQTISHLVSLNRAGQYRAIFTAVIDTYWSIIDEAHFHHGLKDPVLNLVCRVESLHFGKEIVIELLSFLWFCRSMKIRLVTLSSIGKKRKL